MHLIQMIQKMERVVNQANARVAAARRQEELLVKNRLPRDRQLDAAICDFDHDLTLKCGALEILYARRDEQAKSENITDNWFSLEDAIRGGKCHAPRVSSTEILFGGFNTDEDYVEA